MTTESHINQLFDNLDQWRHLPAYQLERRADIFFSLYLAEVLQKRFNLKHSLTLIPEFPCRKGTVIGDGKSNLSFKIDYLALSLNDNKAFFIELKTDANSVDSAQLVNMENAKKVGLRNLIAGVDSLIDKTKEVAKYNQLYQQITPFSNWEIHPEIVYLIPSAPKQGALVGTDIPQIFFSYFADVIEKHPDYLSLRFAKSLREWAAYEAGNLKQ
jgi:hypothetical protein